MKKKILQASISALLLTAGFTTNAQSWSLTGNSGINLATNFLGTTNNKALVLRTNNIERMRINSNGKVGIGTTNPQAKLHITGGNVMYSLSDNGYFILGYDSINNMAFDYQKIQARYNGQAAVLQLNHLGGPVSVGSYNGTVFPALWTNADGRVGIGTNYALAPGYALTVDPILLGNGITINDPGNGYSLYSVKSGNAGAALHVEATDPNSDLVNSIEGINKSTGTAIYGNNNGTQGGDGVEGYSVGGIGVFGYSTDWIGIWGIGGFYAGYFNGDVYANGTYYSSDQKLKQNITEFSSAMDIINQLHPKHYEYRHDGNYKLMNLPSGEHYGLIAQDVEKILPNLVKDSKFETRFANQNTTDKKNSETINFKALNYTELIPIIIKGMQEMSIENEKLKTENNEQQKINQDLQKQIDDLKVILNAQQSTFNISSAYLLQNTPNPFSKNTIIQCYVPSSVKQAQLEVYNVDGRKLKSYMLSNNGMNKISINANALSSGEYVYALLLDGKKIDSKHMTLSP